MSVHAVDFWFDPVSPYAHLAFARLPEALAGVSVDVRYRPIVFGALLRHHAHKGPAEIEPKRAWTFRQVHWLARRHGIPLETPAVHPFNPLALSRLAWATAAEGLTPSRYVCETVLRHVWNGGEDAADPRRLASLADRLAPRHDPAGEGARAALRAATDGAIAAGVFGVPTIRSGGRLFWGFDALEMLGEALRGDAAFDPAAWDADGASRPGVSRAS